MKSKITGGLTNELFTVRILNKYPVKYYQCLDTGFIQTEEPYWLNEAYSSAITKLDLGLVMRNQTLCKKAQRLISDHFDSDQKFLDYAGGYGLFTRMMRDIGFNFFHTDKYCENIFADFFTLEESNTPNFELVTAFEVFEHMVNPIEDIGEILKYSDNLLFTTELAPNDGLDQWWYLSPETGQHIAFHTPRSLQYLAEKNRLNFYSDGWLHLFTKKSFSASPLSYKKDPFFIRKMRKLVEKYDSRNYLLKTRLYQDVEFIKSKIKAN